MKKEKDEFEIFFSQICYLVLMQNLIRKSPIYLMEKQIAFSDRGYFAFQALDKTNREEVCKYYKTWKIPFPKEVLDIMGEDLE